jgi:hypothetical protein
MGDLAIAAECEFPEALLTIMLPLDDHGNSL